MIELLQDYPEAAKLVTSYYLEKMLLSLDDDSLPEDFKEHVRAQGIDVDKIAVLAEASPRTLFDVFDENELYIQINGDNKNGWSWEVGEFIENSLCSSRREAEWMAITEAFKLLNEKLCETKS